MRRFARAGRRAGVIGLSAVFLATACSSDPITDASDNVEFTPCNETECSGTLPGGADFEILLPEDWGGSLALFSHALRSGNGESGTGQDPQGDGQAGAPAPAPLWDDGDEAIADALLSAGYAIAGASPPQPGWAVGPQITAAEELYDYFKDNIAEPNRTYAWGEGTGGLVSARLAEMHEDWVSGAAAMCAPMSGPEPTYNLALDVTYAVRELLLPKLQLVDYNSEKAAQKAYDAIVKAVARLQASTDPRDQALLVFIAGIGKLPDKSRTEAGGTLDSALKAYADGVAQLARQSTVQRYLLQQEVGGNYSGNYGSDYRQRLSAEQITQINELSPGMINKWVTELQDGERISPQEDAVRQLSLQGAVTGELAVPMLTLHNANDPVYIAQNESWYRVRAQQNGTEANANFVDLFALPPVSYGPEEPASEGAGNCVFEPRTVLGVMIQLNDWVRRGTYPGRDTVSKAFGDGLVSITYDPGPWPPMGISPVDAPLSL